MKMSMKRNQEVETKRNEAIRSQNVRELESLKSKLQMSSIPEDVQKLVEDQTERFGRIRIMTLDEFKVKFPDVKVTKKQTIGILDGKDVKTSFPILYMYSPSLAEISEKLKEKHGREANANRLTAALKRRHDIDASEEFRKFAMDLPVDIPAQIFFDGNLKRVASLKDKPDAVMYPGEMAEGVSYCAVQHKLGQQETPTLSIFVPEIDFVKEFSTKISEKLNIAPEIAAAISEHLDHSIYYAIHGLVEKNAQEFASRMAWLLKAEEGDTFTELVSGEKVEVFADPFNGELALDIDDELPAAVLVGNRVNVLIPSHED